MYLSQQKIWNVASQPHRETAVTMWFYLHPCLPKSQTAKVPQGSDFVVKTSQVSLAAFLKWRTSSRVILN